MDAVLGWSGWLALGSTGLVLLFLVFVGFQQVFRSTPLERIRALDRERGPPAADEDAFRREIETLTGTELTRHNTVEVLFDGGGVYPRLFRDLRAATDLVTWHVFWFKPGRLADEVATVLAERARAGVEVLFLHDWYGSRGVPDDYWKRLREAGVEVAMFRPLRWSSLYKLQQRSHTRAVVVDGRIGYTGGFSISDEWLGDGRHPGQWRDTSVRLEGSAVYRLQAGFAADWCEATGELLVGDRAFPEEDASSGDTNAGVLFSAPSIGSTAAERYFALSIRGARRTLWVTSAYFVPLEDLRRLLKEAVARGVDVRVLTPGVHTDKKATWYAARRHYEELLEAGVRIWEYRPTMVHAKTLVADRCWASVGTMNFDNRSMALNDEITVLCHDAGVAGRLADRFLEDLELADELDLETFRRRGALERSKERLAVLAARVL